MIEVKGLEYNCKEFVSYIYCFGYRAGADTLEAEMTEIAGVEAVEDIDWDRL